MRKNLLFIVPCFFLSSLALSIGEEEDSNLNNRPLNLVLNILNYLQDSEQENKNDNFLFLENALFRIKKKPHSPKTQRAYRWRGKLYPDTSCQGGIIQKIKPTEEDILNLFVGEGLSNKEQIQFCNYLEYLFRETAEFPSDGRIGKMLEEAEPLKTKNFDEYFSSSICNCIIV